MYCYIDSIYLQLEYRIFVYRNFIINYKLQIFDYRIQGYQVLRYSLQKFWVVRGVISFILVDFFVLVVGGFGWTFGEFSCWRIRIDNFVIFFYFWVEICWQIFLISLAMDFLVRWRMVRGVEFCRVDLKVCWVRCWMQEFVKERKLKILVKDFNKYMYI